MWCNTPNFSLSVYNLSSSVFTLSRAYLPETFNIISLRTLPHTFLFKIKIMLTLTDILKEDYVIKRLF